MRSFWSLTMYDGKTQLLSENPLKRYLLNSPMLSSMKTAEDRNHRRDETETSASQKQDGTPKSGKRWGGSSMEIPTIQKDLYVCFYLFLVVRSAAFFFSFSEHKWSTCGAGAPKDEEKMGPSPSVRLPPARFWKLLYRASPVLRETLN